MRPRITAEDRRVVVRVNGRVVYRSGKYRSRREAVDVAARQRRLTK